MSLSPKGRLREIASQVSPGASVVDVGCDHGYIPVFLVENNIAEKVYASDINPGPLAAAQRNAEKKGLSDKIDFVLADGIPSCCAGLVDTVIIAGMGGETIISILENSPPLKKGAFFILQPQSKVQEVIDFLLGHGFEDIKYFNTYEDRRNYVIITARTKADWPPDRKD